MIKNFNELVSQIKSQVPIQELISEYITVKRSGRGFVGLCPFHEDHHPSLQIHPQKGIFKCFSCGTGGDLISFYALINKKKWSEAVVDLAQKYGLKIEYGDESKTEIQIKKQLYELNRECLEYFKTNLYSKSGEHAQDYLRNKRGYSIETIKKYEIGYALNSWEALSDFLSKNKKYNKELLIASGLFVIKENQEGYYDRFRNRVIIPILDDNNNVIGFGGRTLSNDDAKYINSPETLIFNKGSILYGLNHAKEEIRQLDYAILTEGYLDVITAHQSGLLNTVASLGTACTIQQIRLLTKYSESKKIYLCMDTDSAGKKAVESIFRLTHELSSYINFDLRVVSNLPGKDLDEALRKDSAENIRALIINSQKLNYFMFDQQINEYLNEKSEVLRKDILAELTINLINIKDPIEQLESIKYISHKINIDEDLLKLKLKEKVKTSKYKSIKSIKPDDASMDETYKMHISERYKQAEFEILALYITSLPSNYEDVKKDLKDFEFLDEKHRLLKEYIDNLTEKPSSTSDMINNLIIEFNEYKHLMSLITDLAWKLENDSKFQSNTFTELKTKIITEAKSSIEWWDMNKNKMKELTGMLKEHKDPEKEKEILSEMILLIRKKGQKE